MSSINFPPFYVGQKVVAVANHQKRMFKIGEQFTIMGIVPSRCKCSGWEVDIGIVSNSYRGHCTDCNGFYSTNDLIYWFDAASFVPFHENFQSISLEKVLEEETKLISVN